MNDQSNPSTKNKIDGNHMGLVEATLDGPHPREPLLEHKFHLRVTSCCTEQAGVVRRPQSDHCISSINQIDHHVTMYSQCEIMFGLVGSGQASCANG